jgi:uncharacterized membrane protein YozB (DUF420 family)
MLHVGSTLVVLLLAVGLWFRKRNSKIHQRIMLSAFAADLLIVIYIESTRHAVEKVVAQVRPLLWFHAGVSVAVLGCYVAMFVLGRRLLAGRIETRKMHRILGFTFVGLRSLNYVTSFMVT